jgi:hypothetical protein
MIALTLLLIVFVAMTFFSCTLEDWFSSEELNAMGVRLGNSRS